MTLGERLNVKADKIATHVLTQMQQNDRYYEEKLGVSTQELHYILGRTENSMRKIAGKYTHVLTKVWYRMARAT
jgi:hypothetical protein